MSKMLDVSGWREFKLSEIFEISGSITTPKNTLERLGKGNYPYVTTQATTNGIANYYNHWSEEGQCLTIDSAVLGVCFYQKEKFSASDHVEILRPKFKMSENIAIFFTILLNRSGEILGYTYNKKRSQTALKQEKIPLPVKTNNEIDFDFMENIIRQTKEKMNKILSIYKGAKNKSNNNVVDKPLNTHQALSFDEFIAAKHNLVKNNIMYIASKLIDTLDCKWGEFKIGDLFSVKSNPQLNKNSFIFNESSKYPYFTRTVYNNGILGYVEYLDEEHKIKGNSIAVGLIAMQFFYMNKDFYAGQFTKTIYPKFNYFNRYIALYFISLLNKNKENYLNNFIVKDFQKDFCDTKLLLPIDSKDKLNFVLMESFIKNIEQKQNSKLLVYYKILKADNKR